ncbi:MAG: UbiA family prenyltransferase [Promethearchaeota archaeon]
MKLKDIIEILRPINDIMGTLTVVIGILNTRTGIPLQALILNVLFGILTYFFIAGSGMVINDYYDFKSGIDVINRPERPIPSGRINTKQAIIIWICSLIIGISISIIHSFLMILGPLNIIIVCFFGFIGWFYAKWGKKSGFLGNLVVSVSFSIGLLYGAILNNSNIPNYIYYFFFTSFFLLLSREIIKGCEDVEGDKKYGVKTLAITLGIKKAKYFALVSAILSVIFFILPLTTNIINPILFLVSMLFGLIIVIIAIILMITPNVEKNYFKKISLLLKVGALLGLIAFVFASI